MYHLFFIPGVCPCSHFGALTSLFLSLFIQSIFLFYFFFFPSLTHFSVLVKYLWTLLSFCVSCSDPPTVEPVFMEMRQGLGRPVVMTCRVLRAHPSRVLRFEWLLSNRLLHAGAFDTQRDETEYTIRSLNRDGWGEYTCNVINEAGAGKCTFQVTGKKKVSISFHISFFILLESFSAWFSYFSSLC